MSSVNFRLRRIRQESKAVISYSLFLYFFLSIPPSQQLFPSSPSPSGFSLNLRVGLQDISKSLWLWKTLAVHSLDLSSKFVLLHLLLFRFAILLGKPLPSLLSYAIAWASSSAWNALPPPSLFPSTSFRTQPWHHSSRILSLTAPGPTKNWMSLFLGSLST